MEITDDQLVLITNQMISVRTDRHTYNGAWGSFDPKSNKLNGVTSAECYARMPQYFLNYYKDKILYTIYNADVKNQATPLSLRWLECLLCPGSPFNILHADHMYIQDLVTINRSGFIWKDADKINLPLWWCFHIASRALYEHKNIAKVFKTIYDLNIWDQLPSLHWAVPLAHAPAGTKYYFPYGAGHTFITGTFHPYIKHFLNNKPQRKETFETVEREYISTYESQNVFQDRAYKGEKKPLSKFGQYTPEPEYTLPELIKTMKTIAGDQ